MTAMEYYKYASIVMEKIPDFVRIDCKTRISTAIQQHMHLSDDNHGVATTKMYQLFSMKNTTFCEDGY